MQKDYHRGFNIFNLDTQEKISYAKMTPYRYISMTNESVPDACLETMKQLESIVHIARKQIDGVKKFYTPNLEEVYGYELSFAAFQYDSRVREILNMSTEPVALASLRDKGVKMAGSNVYFLPDGTPKYLGMGMGTKEIEHMEEFADYENFEKIRKSVTKHFGFFHSKWWFDLTDDNRFSIHIHDNTPYRIDTADVAMGRDERHYLSKKKAFYNALLTDEIITQETHDFIIENCPRMQHGTLKLLWVDKAIERVEFESMCVYDFEDI